MVTVSQNDQPGWKNASKLTEGSLACLCLLLSGIVCLDYLQGEAKAACSQYRYHYFAIKKYNGCVDSAVDWLLYAGASSAEAVTRGPGNESQHGNTFDFVECCVRTRQTGSTSQTNNLNLTNIVGSYIWDAMDEAHYLQQSLQANHGVFVCWDTDDAFASVKACYITTTPPFTYITNCYFVSPESPDGNPMKVYVCPVSTSNSLDGPPGVIFAHEHGHLHGLDHYEQGDNYYSTSDPLLQGNLMWAGNAEDGGADADDGLELWQCTSFQQPNRPNQIEPDPIGYVQ